MGKGEAGRISFCPFGQVLLRFAFAKLLSLRTSEPCEYAPSPIANRNHNRNRNSSDALVQGDLFVISPNTRRPL